MVGRAGSPLRAESAAPLEWSPYLQLQRPRSPHCVSAVCAVLLSISEILFPRVARQRIAESADLPWPCTVSSNELCDQDCSSPMQRASPSIRVGRWMEQKSCAHVGLACPAVQLLLLQRAIGDHGGALNAAEPAEREIIALPRHGHGAVGAAPAFVRRALGDDFDEEHVGFR